MFPCVDRKVSRLGFARHIALSTEAAISRQRR
jgi:hypothetical protein